MKAEGESETEGERDTWSEGYALGVGLPSRSLSLRFCVLVSAVAALRRDRRVHQSVTLWALVMI